MSIPTKKPMQPIRSMKILTFFVHLPPAQMSYAIRMKSSAKRTAKMVRVPTQEPILSYIWYMMNASVAPIKNAIEKPAKNEKVTRERSHTKK